MSDTIIKVENVSKQYRLGEIGTGSLSHDLNRWWSRLRGKEDPYLKIGETNAERKKAAAIMFGHFVILILRLTEAKFGA